MIAARLVGSGDPPTFAVEAPPGPAPGEVAVALHAAALSRLDRWI